MIIWGEVLLSLNFAFLKRQRKEEQRCELNRVVGRERVKHLSCEGGYVKT